MISFVLNLPYTLIGLLIAVFSGIKNIRFSLHLYSFVVKIRSFWWVFGYMNNARAMTIGHVVLLGPKEETNDLEHELVHVKQYSTYPIIFPLLYYFELLLKGYKNNRFEIEAYSLSKSVYRGK